MSQLKENARNMLSDEGSYSVNSNAIMTQLANGQITEHLQLSNHELNDMPLMHVHARKGNCPSRNANRVCVNPRKSTLNQSVDILGKQNHYLASIVSSQRQTLQNDFYSESSTSYACIVPIKQTHAHASTSLPAYEVDKQASNQSKGTRSRRRARKMGTTIRQTYTEARYPV